MPNFRYKARDKYGRPLSGAMSSETKDAVLAYLKEAGYTPISIEESDEISFGRDFFAGFKKVRLEDMIMFTRQLVTLQTAGLPLLMSLAALKEQTESRALKKVITQIAMDIEGGSSFSEALEKHPNVFDVLYVNMVKAGELSGLLDDVLERLATLSEYQLEIRSKIRSATIYPIIVVVTLIAAFLSVITFVVPRFAELFSSFNVVLPLPTRILLAINYVVRHWWHLSTAVIVLAIFLFRRYINTQQGRLVWDNFKLKMPIFGPLFLKITMSRFSRTTAALIKSGIPFLQVLEMASKTVGNMVVSRALDNVKKSINEGKSMHEPMKADKLFPPIVTQMVSVGESTGKLDQLLMRISNYYDSQVDYTLKNLTAAIEPILIFCLGAMVLTMALAIFLPMWNMIQVFKR